jgi:ribosomal protein L37E
MLNVLAGMVRSRARSKLIRIEKKADPSIFLYQCLECCHAEIWDVGKKKMLFSYQFTEKPAQQTVSTTLPEKHLLNGLVAKIPKTRRRLALGILICIGISFLGFYIFLSSIYYIALSQPSSVPIINTASFLGFIPVYVIVLTACYAVLVLLISYVILVLVDKNIRWQEFTLRLHGKMFGQQFYFLENNTKKENTSFVASFKRAVYGSTLVLGFAILIIENFLIIPSLLFYFFSATVETLAILAISLPFIIVLLYISPLLTKEVNLYYFDKKDRIVKNVGSVVEDALHLFSVVDIVLTSVIVIDSEITPAWFGVIGGFVLLVFCFFFCFTLMFNNSYHTRLKEKFLEHLKGTYNIPIRKASVFQQLYYCRSCGTLTDYIQSDRCSTCGTLINKCGICNEILDARNIVGKSPKPSEDGSGGITTVIDRMETRMSGSGGRELPCVACPACGVLFHLDEFIAALKLHGVCPSCKKKLDTFDIF